MRVILKSGQSLFLHAILQNLYITAASAYVKSTRLVNVIFFAIQEYVNNLKASKQNKTKQVKT